MDTVVPQGVVPLVDHVQQGVGDGPGLRRRGDGGEISILLLRRSNHYNRALLPSNLLEYVDPQELVLGLVLELKSPLVLELAESQS
jgi:hypothetical protein